MKYSKLISVSNLKLAWRRITTGRNLQYKRFYRPIYLAYELAWEENVRNLHQRLKGGWTPTTPRRIYIPKASGLQRPITLLELDDQIVLQAVANAFAEKLGARRQVVEHRVVFSNVLSRGRSEFFFQDWRTTYNKYQTFRFGSLFAGYRWVAHFDLASFYDTIAHEVLIRRVSSRGGNQATWNRVREWLKCWSTTEDGFPYDHGIPQGPIASDFLAEAFLLTLDEELQAQGVRYARYVDDITLFGRTRRQAQDAALHLERLCRGLGLIPQGGKYAIRSLSLQNDDEDDLPSLAPPDRDEWDHSQRLEVANAEDLFRSALGGRPYRIKNKTKARFVLYRAPRSQKILGLVLRLLERHPEHIDAFAAYFENYRTSKPLEREVVRLLREMPPYEYVRAELWHILTRIASDRSFLLMRGAAIAELRGAASLAVRWGALRFLFECERRGNGMAGRRIRSQSAHLQALLAGDLPDREFRATGSVAHLLKSNRFEPGIALAPQLAARHLNHRHFGLKVGSLEPEVQNVFRNLGLIQRRNVRTVDQIGNVLQTRYGIPDVREWRRLLGGEYMHALQMLMLADAYYKSARSDWLVAQNSFNDVVVREFARFVNQNALVGTAINVVDKNGGLIKLGSVLQTGGPFDRQYPAIAQPFRDANARRNKLPPAHPYDEKTGRRNRFLSSPEQRTLTRGLRGAYTEVMRVVDAVP